VLLTAIICTLPEARPYSFSQRAICSRSPARRAAIGFSMTSPEGGEFCATACCWRAALPEPDGRPAQGSGLYKVNREMDIQELLGLSVRRGASDLHLTAGLPPLLRIDGDIHRLAGASLDHPVVLTLLHSIMSDKQRREYESLLETDFSFELPGLARFRVNAFHQQRGA